MWLQQYLHLPEALSSFMGHVFDSGRWWRGCTTWRYIWELLPAFMNYYLARSPSSSFHCTKYISRFGHFVCAQIGPRSVKIWCPLTPASDLGNKSADRAIGRWGDTARSDGERGRGLNCTPQIVRRLKALVFSPKTDGCTKETKTPRSGKGQTDREKGGRPKHEAAIEASYSRVVRNLRNVQPPVNGCVLWLESAFLAEQSRAFTSAGCCVVKHISSLGVAIGAIKCPNCSKVALF